MVPKVEMSWEMGWGERKANKLLPCCSFNLSIVLFLCMWVVLGIETTGILFLSYSPSPILFFILKKVLTKLLRALLSFWGWPWTCDPPVSASQVLRLQACATTLGFIFYLKWGLTKLPSSGLKPVILLSLPLKFWVYRPVPPHLVLKHSF